jgi:hypothetical protein
LSSEDLLEKESRRVFAGKTLLKRGGGGGRRLKERVGLVGAKRTKGFVWCVCVVVCVVAFTVHYLSAIAKANNRRMYFWHKTTDVLGDSLFRYRKFKEELLFMPRYPFCRGNSAVGCMVLHFKFPIIRPGVSEFFPRRYCYYFSDETLPTFHRTLEASFGRQ